MISTFGAKTKNPRKMKLLLAIISFVFLLSLNNSLSQVIQDSSEFMSMYNKANEIDQDEYILNFVKYDRYERKTYKRDSTDRKMWWFETNQLTRQSKFWKSYENAKEIVEYFYKLEKSNYSETELTNESNAIIQSFEKLRSLSLILNYVGEYNESGSPHDLTVRKKLMLAISSQMKVMADNNQAWYNYSTAGSKKVKGVQIMTANDLFRPGIRQKNDDMDYTGALKISIATDLLKLDAGRPNQSYQVVCYGGEVYTPYFKDTNIFIKDDTFNILDRPHACFEYFSFENHGISKSYHTRWTTSLQVGKMGGRFGFNFQYFLHKDISLSPYPVGWDGQIAYPSRLALQGQFKLERQFFEKPTIDIRINDNRHFQLYPSGSAQIAVGHFMTFGELGLKVSTHNFKQYNPNSILPRSFGGRNSGVRQGSFKYSKKFRVYGAIEMTMRGVLHNSTLEGFGVINSSEEKKGVFADPSPYYLESDRVERLVTFLELEGGFQFTRLNLFYKYSYKSPEFNTPGYLYTDDGRVLNPNERNHHYATIGVTFIL